MFEEMTFEAILEDMLDWIPDEIDRREGSVIYDALAPCAYKLSEVYFNLDNFLDLVSGDTAVAEYLDKVVADYGITRKAGTYTEREIITSEAIDIGTRWGISDTTYEVTELIAENKYKAKCEQLGTIGNTYTGELEPIDYVGDVTATLEGIIAAGEEEETDNNLRNRFYTQIQSVSTSGNKFDYRNWALEVPGCGDAKVFPLWNGNGTVKVLVVDENMETDAELPLRVYDYIETVRPVGATVTVDAPANLVIDVIANIILDGTKTFEEVQTRFIELFTAYLKETVFEFYSVSHAKIGSLLLSISGVADYSNLTVNGGTSNITIPEEGMPIVGTVTLTEVN